MIDLDTDVWRYIECVNCGQRYHPSRKTARKWLDSKRCPKCGKSHTSSSIETIELNHTTGRSIYLIHAPEVERYKIGVSKHPEKRMDEIQTSRGDEIELIDSWHVEKPFETEKEIHSKLWNSRVSGEWFDCGDTSVYSIANAIELFIDKNAADPDEVSR